MALMSAPLILSGLATSNINLVKDFPLFRHNYNLKITTRLRTEGWSIMGHSIVYTVLNWAKIETGL